VPLIVCLLTRVFLPCGLYLVDCTMWTQMAVYSLYLLLFIWSEPTSLAVAASLGGFAGSVLWTAQGAYFTRNAIAYASVSEPSAGPLFESRIISVFAGLFAVAFQIVTTLAKPLAAILLTLFPGDRALLFGVLTAVAAVCTCAMLFVAPLTAAPGRTSIAARIAETSSTGKSEGGSCERAASEVHARRRLSYRYPRACGGDAKLISMLCERRMLYLTLYNISFGQCHASHSPLPLPHALASMCTHGLTRPYSHAQVLHTRTHTHVLHTRTRWLECCTYPA
jgi:hypothetical protein